MRLWRNNPATPGGKYLVKRRDGTVPDWPYFVLGARDPAAPAALMTYAEVAQARGLDPDYVADIRALADEFREYRRQHGASEPDAPPDRQDDPETVAEMREGRGA